MPWRFYGPFLYKTAWDFWGPSGSFGAIHLGRPAYQGEGGVLENWISIVISNKYHNFLLVIFAINLDSLELKRPY